MAFSRQEYWSGLPFPNPGDLPDPGIKLTSPLSPALEGRFSTTMPPGKPLSILDILKFCQLYLSDIRKDLFLMKNNIFIVIPIFIEQLECAMGSSRLWGRSRTHSGMYAAAAKSLQSCPTLCDPTDGSPPGSPVPGILQAGTLEWASISFSNA